MVGSAIERARAIAPILEASGFAHERAGTVAIRDGSALPRCFRDIHTGTQPALIGEKLCVGSADVLLGNVDGDFAL